MLRFECVICSSNQDEQLELPKDFVPCVLNCSHMYCLKCIITAITQFKLPKSNGLADPVADSDKCPLCREIITSILPLSQMVSSDRDQAHAAIKYFKEINDEDDLVETLRVHKSDICREMNQLARESQNTTPFRVEKFRAFIEHILKHKLFLGSEFIIDTEKKTIRMIGSNVIFTYVI